MSENIQNERLLVLPALPSFEFTALHRQLPVGRKISFPNPSHAHREYEMHILLRGDMSFEIGNRIYPLSRGCVVFIQPYEDHRLFHLSNDEYEYYWLRFCVSDDTVPESLGFPRSPVIVLNNDQLAQVSELMTDLLDGEDTLRHYLAFLQLFRVLGEGHRQPYDSRLRSFPPDVVKALQYMDNHLMEEIRTADLAAVCNVSVNTLERHFQNSLRISPMLMLRKKRLVASMKCLKNGDSVAQAAINSGFSDYSHYVQLFKRQYGITPLQYKKNTT